MKPTGVYGLADLTLVWICSSSCPGFHAHRGAYHLAKPNSPGKNQWNYHGKMVKRTTTRLGPLLPEFFTRTEEFLLFLHRNFGIMRSCHGFNHCLYSLCSRVVHLSCHQEACHKKCLGLMNFRPGARSRCPEACIAISHTKGPSLDYRKLFSREFWHVPLVLSNQSRAMIIHRMLSGGVRALKNL